MPTPQVLEDDVDNILEIQRLTPRKRKIVEDRICTPESEERKMVAENIVEGIVMEKEHLKMKRDKVSLKRRKILTQILTDPFTQEEPSGSAYEERSAIELALHRAR
jgi:hypothetical protein